MKKVISILLMLVLMLNVFCTQSIAANENSYNFVRLDDGSGNKFYGIANVGNTVIVTSTNGKYILSKDAGDTWVEKTVPGGINLHEICSDGTRFVSIDIKGKVFVSMDGEKWDTSVSVWNSTLAFFEYDGKYFYIGYTDGKLFRSVDGTTWTKLCSNLPEGTEDIAVNYESNTYAFSIANNNTIKYTKDFKTYKSFVAGNCETSYYDIGYANGLWYFSIITGIVATSKDLLTTNKLVNDFEETDVVSNTTYLANLVKMIYRDGKMYVLGFLGKIRDITDMSSIKKVTSELQIKDRMAISMSGIVKVGDSFITYSKSGEIFKYSNNKWIRIFGKQSLTYKINSIPDKKIVLALAENSAVLLSDGKVSAEHKINLKGNKWLWYDNKITVKAESYYTATSTDFKNWTSVNTASNKFPTRGLAQSDKTGIICISPSKDVYAFSDSRGYYSLKVLPLNPNYVANIGGDIYVVGNGGVGLKISDKLKTTAFNINKETCYKIIKAKDTFVALHKNSISTSKDLNTWTTTKVSDSYALNDITYDDKNNIFVIACSNGTLLTSKDLKTWYITDLNISVSAYGVASYNGYVYVVAEGGVIMASNKLVTSSKKAVVTQLKTDSKEITVFVENNKLVFSQKPYVEKGITMVPINDIVTSLGGTVETKGTSTYITFNNKTIEIKVNSDKVTINGKSVALGTKAKAVGNTVFVPVQFISNNLDCSIYVEGFSNTIYVSKK